jgi:hypothetical protein
LKRLKGKDDRYAVTPRDNGTGEPRKRLQSPVKDVELSTSQLLKNRQPVQSIPRIEKHFVMAQRLLSSLESMGRRNVPIFAIQGANA